MNLPILELNILSIARHNRLLVSFEILLMDNRLLLMSLSILIDQLDFEYYFTLLGVLDGQVDIAIHEVLLMDFFTLSQLLFFLFLALDEFFYSLRAVLSRCSWTFVLF